MQKRIIPVAIIGLLSLAGVAHANPKVYKTKNDCMYVPQDQIPNVQTASSAVIILYYDSCMKCINQNMYYNYTTLATAKCIPSSGKPAPPAPGSNIAVEAGPLSGQAAAQSKCGPVCTGAGDTWTGAWWTTIPGQMSVCECKIPATPTTPAPGTKKSFNAGPLNNQTAANNKCPSVCTTAGAKNWDGGWWTTVPGQMSVCECVF